jgi:hypothetical protein
LNIAVVNDLLLYPDARAFYRRQQAAHPFDGANMVAYQAEELSRPPPSRFPQLFYLIPRPICRYSNNDEYRSFRGAFSPRSSQDVSRW